MRLLILLLSATLAVAASNFQVYPHDSEEPLCVEKACARSEVCVVKHKAATCFPKDKLFLLRGKHAKATGQHHKAEQHHHKHHSAVDHARHDKLGKHKCSQKELFSMGGRLLQWFSDMHRINGGIDRTLKAHHVTCRRDVAWMFEQWDGDNDGKLSKSELVPLEGGGGERCTAQFIDMCDDIQVDGSISIDEWCDCFTFSDDLRHEPPCHKEKHNVDPHMHGVFLPRCDLEGFYRPEQCFEGKCWCVDRFGREFDHSRVEGQLPDCGQYASELTEEETSDLRDRL